MGQIPPASNSIQDLNYQVRSQMHNYHALAIKPPLKQIGAWAKKEPLKLASATWKANQ